MNESDQGISDKVALLSFSLVHRRGFPALRTTCIYCFLTGAHPQNSFSVLTCLSNCHFLKHHAISFQLPVLRFLGFFVFADFIITWKSCIYYEVYLLPMVICLSLIWEMPGNRHWLCLIHSYTTTTHLWSPGLII